MSIYKVGYSKSPQLVFSDQGFERLECLHACLQTLKNFFEVFQALSPSNYHRHPTVMMKLVSRAHVILEVLGSFQHPEWDLDYSNSILSFSNVLLVFADRMESASSALGFQPPGSDLFLASGKRTRTIEEYCRQIASQNVNNTERNEDYQPTDFNGMAMDDYMGFFDETMLNDVLGPFGNQGYLSGF